MPQGYTRRPVEARRLAEGNPQSPRHPRFRPDLLTSPPQHVTEMPLISRILEWRATMRSYFRALPFLVLSLCAVNAPAHAFMITAPAGESLLRSGQQVGATVDLGTEIGMLRVQYYWYRQGEEPLVPQQAGPALVATASSSPPYGGTPTLPPDAIGKMRLPAGGGVGKGRVARGGGVCGNIFPVGAPPD